METTTKLLNEIAGLKQYRNQVIRALVRTEQWYAKEVSNPNTEGRIIEKDTLEKVLRIFKEEGVSQ